MPTATIDTMVTCRSSWWMAARWASAINGHKPAIVKLIELAYFTDDVDRMADFYSRMLHAAPVARSEGMAIFLVGVTKIFIHKRYLPAQGELPPENHIALQVEDIELTCRQIIETGIAIDIPPQDYYWGRSAYLRDPEGRLIELIQALPGE